MRKMLQAAVVAVCILNGSALAATINLSTGLDSGGSVQTTNGALDANWVVSPGGSAGQVVAPGGADAGFPSWVANDASSAWITRDASTPFNGVPLPTFTRTFDLTGLDLSTASVSGQWTLDDAGDLVVNGHTVSTLGTGSWGSLFAFTIPAADLNQGVNTLQIVMTSSDNFIEGARLTGSLTAQPLAAVPEPGYLALVGLGFAGLFGVRKPRRR
jgi:PEP-CTERM motif